MTDDTRSSKQGTDWMWCYENPHDAAREIDRLNCEVEQFILALRKATAARAADEPSATPRAWMNRDGFISSAAGGSYDIPLYERAAQPPTAVRFHGCTFQGNPPEPFTAWNQWAAVQPYSGVTISTLSRNDPKRQSTEVCYCQCTDGDPRHCRGWIDNQDEPPCRCICHEPEIPERITEAVDALCREPVYEDREMAKGISPRFLMRITLLKDACGMVDHEQPMVEEARAALTKPDALHTCPECKVQWRGDPAGLALIHHTGCTRAAVEKPALYTNSVESDGLNTSAVETSVCNEDLGDGDRCPRETGHRGPCGVVI